MWDWWYDFLDGVKNDWERCKEVGPRLIPAGFGLVLFIVAMKAVTHASSPMFEVLIAISVCLLLFSIYLVVVWILRK